MKEDIKTFPIWIQMKLDFKYWGEHWMFKIAKQIGCLIKIDQAIVKKDKRQYGRLMLEVSID